MQDRQFSPGALSSPLCSEPPAPRTTSVPLIAGAKELSRLLAPPDIQIDKPQRIPADLLRPFQTGLKELWLLPTQSKKLVLATLGVLQETYLCADTLQAVSLSAYKDRVLLVIFPVMPTQKYVLQTWITEVYLDRLQLRYQDPRYDRRWTFQVATSVLLRPVPADLVSLLEHDQIRLERETIDGAEALGSMAGEAITDHIIRVPTTTADALVDECEDASPLTCSLYDISLGGVCLTVQGTPPAVMTQQFVTLQIILPGIAPTSAEDQTDPLHLSLLGVVRHVRAVRRSSTLHIRFLQRLPAALDTVFAALEQRFLRTKLPLA